jgi:hypothetical protein
MSKERVVLSFHKRVGYGRRIVYISEEDWVNDYVNGILENEDRHHYSLSNSYFMAQLLENVRSFFNDEKIEVGFVRAWEQGCNECGAKYDPMENCVCPWCEIKLVLGSVL